ncbi:MAG: CBS domain-containing protein [Woeseiaceae bacterium]|nr:CBS domain-containing protein [Woeseiaceae bacterium]
MVPRSQMVVIERNQGLDDMLRVIVDSGHSRFPVIGEDRDEVLGVLLAKDLLRHFGSNGGDSLRIEDYIRPLSVIPESQAPQCAAQGISRQSQPHGDRRRRIRRCIGPVDDRGRAGGNRRRNRRRARPGRGRFHTTRRRTGRPAQLVGARTDPHRGFQRLLRL